MFTRSFTVFGLLAVSVVAGVPQQGGVTDPKIVDLLPKVPTMEEMARLREPKAKTPNEALDLLKRGNMEFYTGATSRTPLSAFERRVQILSQTPFAIILGCSDSRVPTELLFNQGPGDLFVTRVAGNVAEPGTMGTVQYGIAHLKSKLVVVMGHEGCGAVKAAMLPAADQAREPAHVRFLLNLVQPAVRGLPKIRDEKAKMREAVSANVRYQVHQVMQDTVVKAAAAAGQIRVVGGFYEIGSGAVDFFDTPEELAL